MVNESKKKQNIYIYTYQQNALKAMSQSHKDVFSASKSFLHLFTHRSVIVKTLPQTNYSSYLEAESIFLVCHETDTRRDEQDIFFLSVNLIAYVVLLCDCGRLLLQK